MIYDLDVFLTRDLGIDADVNWADIFPKPLSKRVILQGACIFP